MANPIPCDLCDAPWGHFVLTIQESGLTQGICVDCLPAFAEALVQAKDAAAEQETPSGVIEPDPAELPADHPQASNGNGKGRSRKTSAPVEPEPEVSETTKAADVQS